MSKKEALTRAAADLLWERGYTGTSPAMILERAHAGQGSMYHHFSGKAELAVAAMSHMSDQRTPRRSPSTHSVRRTRLTQRWVRGTSEKC
ncbi:helix-turn-helix domain-containing protein [Streptomyces sp. H27-D2]|uniref:helix-turn-helix domain-containing protein n=1 Tax=Streptomyces sp. H27-D2 TaxID=3046304 RepID=UPI002DBAD4BF|nr:helix-turn-helix domain-containing protein [Streptomyces sp. H27-D2]MEC4019604.1 helix-turn-helix domain-containing protein [Streptomyces sp. H27-D2]